VSARGDDDSDTEMQDEPGRQQGTSGRICQDISGDEESVPGTAHEDSEPQTQEESRTRTRQRNRFSREVWHVEVAKDKLSSQDDESATVTDGNSHEQMEEEPKPIRFSRDLTSNMLRQEAAEVSVLSEANVQSGMRAGLPAMMSNDKILWSNPARCAQRRNVKILEGNEDIGTRKRKFVRNRSSSHASREECCMLKIRGRSGIAASCMRNQKRARAQAQNTTGNKISQAACARSLRWNNNRFGLRKDLERTVISDP